MTTYCADTVLFPRVEQQQPPKLALDAAQAQQPACTSEDFTA